MPSKPARLLHQFMRFAGVGLTGTAAHLAVMMAGVEWLGFGPVASATAGYVTGALVNYTLVRWFVFGSGVSMARSGFRFLVVASFGMGFNAALMALLVDGVGLHYVFSQIVSTGVVLLWNFAANKWWSFRN